MKDLCMCYMLSSSNEKGLQLVEPSIHRVSTDSGRSIQTVFVPSYSPTYVLQDYRVKGMRRTLSSDKGIFIEYAPDKSACILSTSLVYESPLDSMHHAGVMPCKCQYERCTYTVRTKNDRSGLCILYGNDENSSRNVRYIWNRIVSLDMNKNSVTLVLSMLGKESGRVTCMSVYPKTEKDVMSTNLLARKEVMS